LAGQIDVLRWRIEFRPCRFEGLAHYASKLASINARCETNSPPAAGARRLSQSPACRVIAIANDASNMRLFSRNSQSKVHFLKTAWKRST
jgi:hypothetical protein